MKSLNLKQIKEVELNILLSFQKCCQENELMFYLCGGTMLGAARHKGFIPWDDDIDVCMPRPHYSRLIKLYRKNPNILPPHLKLICYEMGTMNYPFMKIVDTRTRCAKEFLNEGGMDELWIDILPVDGLPADEKEVKKVYKEVSLARQILMWNNAKIGNGKTAIRRILKYVAIPTAKLIGTKRSNRFIRQLVRKHPYSRSEYVGIITWGLYGSSERMKKTEFETPVEVEFEGHLFPAMSCWKSYLENLYGDYMKLPPVEQRVTHDMKVWMQE